MLCMYDALNMSSSSTEQTGTYADALAAALRRRIAAGEFDAAGGKLPSEAELIRGSGHSKPVIRAALARLAAEGMIVSLERRGHYVRRADPITLTVSGDWGEGSQAALARKPARTGLQVRIVGGPDDPVPADIAARLRISPAAQVVLRDRICYLDDRPYLLWPSWYHIDVALGTPLMRASDQSGPGGLLAQMGITATPADDYLRARMATADEAARLQLPAVTAVLTWARTLVDGVGIPVAVQEAVMPGDRVALTGTLT
jgi:DNA-binding GntR family transcriptional regulator